MAFINKMDRETREPIELLGMTEKQHQMHQLRGQLVEVRVFKRTYIIFRLTDQIILYQEGNKSTITATKLLMVYTVMKLRKR